MFEDLLVVAWRTGRACCRGVASKSPGARFIRHLVLCCSTSALHPLTGLKLSLRQIPSRSGIVLVSLELFYLSSGKVSVLGPFSLFCILFEAETVNFILNSHNVLGRDWGVKWLKFSFFLTVAC